MDIIAVICDVDIVVDRVIGEVDGGHSDRDVCDQLVAARYDEDVPRVVLRVILGHVDVLVGGVVQDRVRLGVDAVGEHKVSDEVRSVHGHDTARIDAGREHVVVRRVVSDPVAAHRAQADVGIAYAGPRYDPKESTTR